MRAGERIAGSSIEFGQSGGLEVRAHFEALDERPEDDATWLVWADALMERSDPLGAWLMERRRADQELWDQLGAVAPLVQGGLVEPRWNRFGFVSHLELRADVFLHHRFVTDATFSPAVQYLGALTLTGVTDVDAALTAVATARWPRSLRRLRFVGTPALQPRAEEVLTGLRAQCPRLETNALTLW